MAFMLILLVDNVEALTISTEIGFSSEEVGYNIDGTWNSYSSNNLNKSLSGMTTKELTALNYRFTLNDYFKSDNTYNISFNLRNSYIYYNEDYTFRDNILELLNRNFKCYFTSSGSVQTADTCFESYNFDIDYVNVQEVKYNITFKPKQNIWRLLVQQESGENEYPPIYTTYGWETSNLTAGIVDLSSSSTDMTETNEKLDNINDSLTDSNVDSSDATGFFDDFTTEDNGGISGIVTAPLNMVNSLLQTGTCSDFSFSILGKDVSLPCGSILWNSVPTAILVIYHTIICGYFSYLILKSLFKDIEKMKNPNSSEVNTIDL